MQAATPIDDLKNTGEWYVYHNPITHLFQLKSGVTGNPLSGSYTHRTIAERELINYLEKQATMPNGKAMKKKNVVAPEPQTLEDVVNSVN